MNATLLAQDKQLLNKTVDDITQFLLSCGGPYKEEYIRPLQENIIFALATETYIYIPDKAFISWWLVDDDAIDDLAEGIQPIDRLSGDICYVVELGIKSYSLSRLAAQVRRKVPHAIGACWYRYKHSEFVFHPTQKGKE